MSNATRGAAFERKVRDEFLAAGWFVVRAGASLGCADLLAIEPVEVFMACDPEQTWTSGGEIAFVQAKLGGPGRCPPAEWDELYETAMRYGGVPVLVHRPKRGRLEYLRIIGPKTGVRGARPPCEPWEPWRVGLAA